MNKKSDLIMVNWTRKMIDYWEEYLKENPDSELVSNVKEAIKTLKYYHKINGGEE
ncbi:unnamed protein product [marine sediment metagenome]|uniref:Uncharacterized protein n=1 Tax=marine sediment metagenome TaxID=412755 RepID=X0YIA4_9ZZZZ